jgi:hypothetical protein
VPLHGATPPKKLGGRKTHARVGAPADLEPGTSCHDNPLCCLYHLEYCQLMPGGLRWQHALRCVQIECAPCGRACQVRHAAMSGRPDTSAPPQPPRLPRRWTSSAPTPILHQHLHLCMPSKCLSRRALQPSSSGAWQLDKRCQQCHPAQTVRAGTPGNKHAWHCLRTGQSEKKSDRHK